MRSRRVELDQWARGWFRSGRPQIGAAFRALTCGRRSSTPHSGQRLTRASPFCFGRPSSDQACSRSGSPCRKTLPLWSRITARSLPGAGRNARPICCKKTVSDLVGRSRIAPPTDAISSPSLIRLQLVTIEVSPVSRRGMCPCVPGAECRHRCARPEFRRYRRSGRLLANARS